MARFHQISKATKERIGRLEKVAKELQDDLDRTKKEIEMEKVALRCLEASVKITNLEGSNYHVNIKEVEGFSSFFREEYFIECCAKLGLDVDDYSGSVSYLTNTTGTK